MEVALTNPNNIDVFIGKVLSFIFMLCGPLLMPVVLQKFTPTGLRPHPNQNKPHPKLIVHVPGLFKHPANPLCQRGALGQM